jgi:hypothetical protein
VVVGGFATVLHGYARLTADIDLVIDLVPDEARKAIETLTRIGFRPRVPVEPLVFADPAVRRQWLGRPQDVADIEALRIILRRREGPDAG